MDAATFDTRFTELFTAMVNLAYDYVERNKEEVDAVYVFGSMETGEYYYNACYRINGRLVRRNKVNTVSVKKYDDSNPTLSAMSRKGIQYLRETAQLFRDDDREVPTQMKMVYHPKTGSFNNDISYELYYTDNDLTIDEVFVKWFEELGQQTS